MSATMDMPAPMGQGEVPRTKTTKVSAQEELLYGPYAQLVRRLGRVAEEAEAAMDHVVAALDESGESDQLTAGTVREVDAPPEEKSLDDLGRSEHTRWVQTVYERVSDVRMRARVLHQDTAQQALARWIQVREDAERCDEGGPQDGPLSCVVEEGELTAETLGDAALKLGARPARLLVGDGRLKLIARRIVCSDDPAAAVSDPAFVVQVPQMGEGRWMLVT